MENTIIKYPLSTEKAIRLMESENKMLFVVDNSATRSDVKKAIQDSFNVKVANVNVFKTNRGQKRAYVRFAAETPAIDVATKLGIL